MSAKKISAAEDAIERAADRVRALLPKAVAALEGALAGNPDLQFAIEALKLAGVGADLLRGEAPTDAGDNLAQDAWKQNERELKLLIAGHPIRLRV